MDNNHAAAMGPAGRALLAALLLAGVHQYLFWGKPPGVSYPLFVCLFYAFMLYFAKDKLRRQTLFGYVWLGSIVLLSLTYGLFNNFFFYGLNFLMIPALILLHMTYMLSYRNPSWSSFKLIGAAAEHFFAQAPRHLPTVFKIFRRPGGDSAKSERKQVLIKVLIGLAVSCPLLIIVVSLLSSADGVFNQMLNSIPELLDMVSFGEGFTRILWILVLGLGMFGFLWGFVDSKAYDWNVPVQKGDPVPEPFTFNLDPVVMTTILTVINAVYVLFVCLQFTYLFSAWEGILPEGSTYADYARSGFFELILVTGINFVILLLALYTLGAVKTGLQKGINILLYILVLCSMVMLYSAFTRLALYEEAYGYTYIRFLVHAFMIFLGLLMVLTAIRISRVKFPLAQCYIVLGMLSYVLMNYIGMDSMIADKNIQRYEETGKLDAGYLTGLSWEAVPKLIEFSKQHDGMLDSQLAEKLKHRGAEAKWPSFNLAEHRGERALVRYFQ
ncbi:DUF4173 domain-containing protein [Paenibacillus sp. PK3_47]|uniref:DUF4153 domain-containing protein n=1 Tax=Paenibacillus sp. PK3_47 TaxID=2072642 RepID=UPI00201E426B|nr:DUF4173 domain-containing protein [Paenibacillus sp. PK3_47]UQZ36227.1 DUF4173 domain-containing protein [Paenibacillus sp. PK3_47]